LVSVSVTCVSYAAEGWGTGEVWHDGGLLVWHELPRPVADADGSLGTRARARGRARETPSQGGGNRPPPSRSTIPATGARVSRGTALEAQQLVHRLEAYFGGAAADFADVEIDLEGWTPFQLDILRALRRVPYGEVVSYADLARLAGYPRAQRAAGTFCARNRFPLVVPCHRVVSANGLGSYGSLGLEYKRRLLELEGVTV
jgi:methylated-DNA-[protein]-cysteine S-methyltransferase